MSDIILWLNSTWIFCCLFIFLAWSISVGYSLLVHQSGSSRWVPHAELFSLVRLTNLLPLLNRPEQAEPREPFTTRSSFSRHSLVINHFPLFLLLLLLFLYSTSSSFTWISSLSLLLGRRYRSLARPSSFSLFSSSSSFSSASFSIAREWERSRQHGRTRPRPRYSYNM